MTEPAFAGRAPEPAPSGGTSAQLPKDPSAAFGRMRDAFERETGQGSGKTDGAKGGPFSADAPLLPGLAILVRNAGERCSDAAVKYLDEADKGGRSAAPAAIMDTLGLLLQVAAMTMDDLVKADQE